MRTYGKNQESSANDSAFFSEETTLNLTASCIFNESFMKCKLQSPKFQRRSEVSLEHNESILALASAANQSLCSILKRDRTKVANIENKHSQSSTSGSESSLTLKESNGKNSKISKLCNDIKPVPSLKILQKTPDVSPIRPLPEKKSKIPQKEKKEIQKSPNEKTRVCKPNLTKSGKFDIIFTEKILPVLLKSTKHKDKAIENHKPKPDNEVKAVEKSKGHIIINRVIKSQGKKK
mmetsp:Transcript_32971/g.32660  ORF Transcript_32971/g.32660 Transcript_32971/m.32660 type:complete len:235 (-) Transcript_32971:42-746(-)